MTLGVNGIGSSSYYTDPYFLYALNSYNPNFQGMTNVPSATGTEQTANNAAAAATANTTNTANTASNTTASNPAFTGEEEKSSSHTGLIVTGLTGTAALIYAAKRGNGKGIKAGFKNIWKSITGNKAAQETAKDAASSVSDKLRAALDKKGNLVYTIPGKNKTVKGVNEINKYAKEYDINTKQLQKFNSENSTLKGYEFTYKDGGIDNVVRVKDGKIVDINNGVKSIKDDILDSTKPEDIAFVEKLEKQIAKIEQGTSGNASAYKGLRNIEYQTQIGDDTVTVLRKSIDSKPEIRELTTLERFSQDSEALKAYLYNNPEAKQAFVQKTLEKGRIPEGVKIESFDYNFSRNIQCKYKDGKLEGIVKDGKYYEKGTDTCDAFLADNEEILNKAIEKLLKKGKLQNFHNAVLVAA